LQEPKIHSQVKMWPLKCWVAKSSAQISTQLSATQLSWDLSGVLQSVVDMRLTSS